jgi:hypothetical protein
VDDGTGGHITVSGTATADNPGTDQVDVYCYFSHDGQVDFQGGVTATVQNDGSFSANVPLNQLDGETCRLRAVPSGTFPSNLTPFTGPRIGVLQRFVNTITGGWQTYSLGLNSLSGIAVLDDPSFCAVEDMKALDPSTLNHSLVFACGDSLHDRDLSSPSTRSEIQVDGKDAYFAVTLFDANGTRYPLDPLPALSPDTSTGLGSVSSQEALSFCAPGGGFPTSASNCSDFAATGVRLDHTGAPLGSGHLLLTSDTFVSVDGNAHDLDLLYETGANQNTSTWRFPGQSSFAGHTTDVVSGFSAGAGATLLDQSGASFGVFAWSAPPESVRFNEPADFEAHYVLHIAPGCPATIKFAFGYAFTSGEVNALTPPALDAVNVESSSCPSSGPIPPVPPPPHVTSAKLHRVKIGGDGTVTVLVDVTDPGSVSAVETALVPRSARKKTKRLVVSKARKTAAVAGQVKLVLKLNRKGKKLLRTKHRLPTTLAVTYKPTSGAGSKLTRHLKLKAKSHKG